MAMQDGATGRGGAAALAVERAMQRHRAMSGATRFVHRSGFTLVELLVVIGIIAMLAAILTPTVMQAVGTARDAAIKNEVEMLHSAIMNYKSEYGEFPPSDLSDTAAVRGHLLRLFPRINQLELTNAVNTWALLSPAQALVLWLTGYYDNPQYPVTNNGGGGTRNKLYDFDQSRLYGVTGKAINSSAGYLTWTESIVSRVNAADGFPVYVGQNCKGVPFVYFASPYLVARTPNTILVPAYNVASSLGGSGATSIAPYLSSLVPLDSGLLYQFSSDDRFQIIAPGRDGDYGEPLTNGSVTIPMIVGATNAGGSTPLSNDKSANQKILQQLAYPFTPSCPMMNGGHRDNVTNFAQGPLKTASQKALQ
jgi:prepilin-type N-terminal cleavage/methylation domain-containing protein